MKKTIILATLMICIIILLTGCSKNNPYEEIQGYDGTYQFTTSWTIDAGIVTHSGFLVLDNGKCEIHSSATRSFNTDKTEHIFKGFYGMQKGDTSSIYLNIYNVSDNNYEYNEDVEYKCTIKGKNLVCELLDGREETILTKNDKVEFIYYTNNTNLNEVKKQIEVENVKENNNTTNESTWKKYLNAIDEYKKAEIEYNQAKMEIEEIEKKIREEKTDESTIKEYSEAMDKFDQAELKYNQARKDLTNIEDKWREEEQSK